MVPVNRPAMRMATVFMKFMSTRWKVFGRYRASGYVLIAAFLKLICQFIWDFLSLCITQKKRGKVLLGSLLELIIS